MQNSRFLAEMTKFSLVPAHSILHAFKVCVDDLAGPNVDNLCNLMEGCGRYLLRTDATREKMTQLVRFGVWVLTTRTLMQRREQMDQMKRKKMSQNMDQRAIMMLENAYYQVRMPSFRMERPSDFLRSATLRTVRRSSRRSGRLWSFTSGTPSTTS